MSCWRHPKTIRQSGCWFVPTWIQPMYSGLSVDWARRWGSRHTTTSASKMRCLRRNCWKSACAFCKRKCILRNGSFGKKANSAFMEGETGWLTQAQIAVEKFCILPYAPEKVVLRIIPAQAEWSVFYVQRNKIWRNSRTLSILTTFKHAHSLCFDHFFAISKWL